MATSQMEKFGRLIIDELWNKPIEYHDLLAKGHLNAPRLEGLQSAMASLSEEQKKLVRRCVIEALNTGLHGFLFALQEAHDLEEGIEVITDGVNIAGTSDGLQGEPYGEDGWISSYGKYPELD